MLSYTQKLFSLRRNSQDRTNKLDKPFLLLLYSTRSLLLFLKSVSSTWASRWVYSGTLKTRLFIFRMLTVFFLVVISTGVEGGIEVSTFSRFSISRTRRSPSEIFCGLSIRCVALVTFILLGIYWSFLKLLASWFRSSLLLWLRVCNVLARSDFIKLLMSQLNSEEICLSFILLSHTSRLRIWPAIICNSLHRSITYNIIASQTVWSSDW
jgi:hypothetical protein